MLRSNRVRKLVLTAIWFSAFLHLSKDITQDILKVATPLDLLGNINEDLSSFPDYMQRGFGLLGIASFLVEAYLLVVIPLVFRRLKVSLLEKSVYISTMLMSLYFLAVFLLDPRFRITRF